MGKKIFAKRALPMALATAVALSPVQVMAASNDLAGHWAEKTITEWQDKGLISGYSDGSFKPNNNITRAEFVTIMNNALGFSATDDISFTDVTANDWFYNAVAKAVAAGYTVGYEDGTFKPGKTISRAEAAVMIANAAGLEGYAAGAADFSDLAAIPAWALGSVGAVVDAGFMSGYPDGSFGAGAAITRAEAVSSLNRVMGGIAEAPEEEVVEDVVVTEDDEVVEDQVIKGDLIIDEEVGDGEVYVNDVTVEGDIIVKGGGDDSVYLDNVNVLGEIRVLKTGVRLHFTGDTNIPHILMRAIAQLSSDNTFEGEIEKITIPEALGTGSRVQINVPADEVVIEGKANVLIGEDVAKVTIAEEAEGTRVEIASDATVGTLVADAKTTLAGSGEIETLEASEDVSANKNLGKH